MAIGDNEILFFASISFYLKQKLFYFSPSLKHRLYYVKTIFFTRNFMPFSFIGAWSE